MKKIFPIVLKVFAAFIMLQTLYFKFSCVEESINLFTTIAGESEILMRFTTGILELIAAILLFIPKKNVAWCFANYRINERSNYIAFNNSCN